MNIIYNTSKYCSHLLCFILCIGLIFRHVKTFEFVSGDLSTQKLCGQDFCGRFVTEYGYFNQSHCVFHVSLIHLFTIVSTLSYINFSSSLLLTIAQCIVFALSFIIFVFLMICGHKYVQHYLCQYDSYFFLQHLSVNVLSYTCKYFISLHCLLIVKYTTYDKKYYTYILITFTTTGLMLLYIAITSTEKYIEKPQGFPYTCEPYKFIIPQGDYKTASILPFISMIFILCTAAYLAYILIREFR